MGFFDKIFGKSEKSFDVDKLLRSSDINSSIIEFDNYIGELCDYGNSIENLNESQKLFYLNQNLEREVNNGGFYQYFYNASGDFAHETVAALEKIGANKTASILKMAIDQFPNKEVPTDSDDRIKVIQKIESKVSETWEELDRSFYEYEDNLNALNIEFIRTSRLSFEK